MGAAEPERLEVSVRADKMQVTVRFTDRSGEGPLPIADEVLRVVNREKVVVTHEVAAAIKAYAEKQLTDPERRFDEATIAMGRPVEDGREADFIWDEAVEPRKPKKKGRGGVDHYAFTSIIPVGTGTLLGTIVAAVPSRAGVDVFGTAIEPRTWCKDIELHKSVRLEEDGSMQVYAATAGVASFANNELRIDEAVELHCDVDFATGNLKCATDISIGGAVLDNFTVKSAGTIKVAGPIEGAKLSARKDVEAKGGILGKEIGVVQAAGRITAKFAEEAHLRAKGDIVVARAFVHCVVETQARIIAPQATVRGGRMFAHVGAEIGELGSEAAVPTRIAIGVDPKVAAAALELEDEIGWIKQDIGPLRAEHNQRLAKAKRRAPTEGQLLRIRQLDSEVRYLQGLIEELCVDRDAMIEAARPPRKAVLHIVRKLQPGAQIQFGVRVAFLRHAVRGPLRVEERCINDKDQLVVIDINGNATVLHSERATKPQQETRRTVRRSRWPRSTRPPPPRQLSSVPPVDTHPASDPDSDSY